MVMGPAQMASGGGGIPMPPPQGGASMPPPPQGMTSTPDQAQVGGDLNKILEALGQAIQQTVDQQGFVDLQQLVTIWPQIAQQAGINVPFQTVIQLIQQNPEMMSDLIVRHGLAGITVNGQRISAEQLAGMGTGAVGGGKM